MALFVSLILVATIDVACVIQSTIQSGESSFNCVVAGMKKVSQSAASIRELELKRACTEAWLQSVPSVYLVLEPGVAMWVQVSSIPY
jgi:hypothetical protein